MRLHAIWVGPPGEGEFAAAYDTLDATSQLQTVADCDGAIEAMRLQPPDLVVLPQAWPGCFSAAAIDELRRQAPLARFLSLLGSWCEGEGRSGAPLPATVPLAWHAWPARYVADLQRNAAGHCPLWGLPVTSLDAERFLSALSDPWPSRTGQVAICAQSPEMGACLEAACRARGYETHRISIDSTTFSTPVDELAAVVWEAPTCDELWSPSLRALATCAPGLPLVALLDFPRLADVRAAIQAGAAAVLAKPLQFEDLFLLLESPAASRPGRTW